MRVNDLWLDSIQCSRTGLTRRLRAVALSLAFLILMLGALAPSCRRAGGSGQGGRIGVQLTYNSWEIGVRTDAAPETVDKNVLQASFERRVKLASGEEALQVIAKSTTTAYEAGKVSRSMSRVDTQYVRETPTALLNYRHIDSDSPDTVLALPLTPNKTWHVDRWTVARVARREDVTVRAGSYPQAWRTEQTISRPKLPVMEATVWYDSKTLDRLKFETRYPMKDTTVMVLAQSELVKAGKK
jgi:hypothetical protein